MYCTSPMSPASMISFIRRTAGEPYVHRQAGAARPRAFQFFAMLLVALVFFGFLYRDEKTLKPVQYYNKLPVEPTVSLCLILDPMLATGGSAVATTDIVKRWGVKKIKFVGLIGAPEGLAAMQKALPDVPIYLAAIDDHLNERGYIVPGLGDAGDRQFGTG